jgi:hypothetical protein
MSFILDALKKLEQKRKMGAVPDLTTVHLQDHEPPKKRSKWPYLLLAALLLNAGIFAAWLRPWEEKDVISAQPDVNGIEEVAGVLPAPDKADDTNAMQAEKIIENKEAAMSTPEEDNQAKEEISETVMEPDKLIEQEEPVEKSDEEVIASIGLNPTPEELDILRNKIKEDQNVQVQMPVEEILNPAEPDIIEPKDKSGFIEFSQLPGDVKKELPDITINGHIYSDNSAARIANINGFVTREGDKVASGLILEEITESGAIFTYKEYRFRMRAF